jgi:hypothetical protein
MDEDAAYKQPPLSGKALFHLVLPSYRLYSEERNSKAWSQVPRRSVWRIRVMQRVR